MKQNSRRPKTGDTLVFHDRLQATVIGLLDRGYALLFSPTGDMKDVSVRIMTHELWEELCAEGAVRFSDEAPKKATKKKETTKGAVKPPWSK